MIPNSDPADTKFPPPLAEAPTLPPRQAPLPDSPLDSAIAGRETPSIPGYEILGILGQGGMGVVYKARQLKADRIVAVKMIVSGVHAGEAERVRFAAEADAVARLQHPNIVQIFEVGEHAGLPYFSLEFCGCGNLASVLTN
jgi:serine/threonine protein kinase